MQDCNFIDHRMPDADKDLFFGPVAEDDFFCHIDHETMTMAHIMKLAGIFPSVSQARKNGWDKPIPKGFTNIRVGKLKTRIVILNVF